MDYLISELLEQFDAVLTCFSYKVADKDSFRKNLPNRPSLFLNLNQRHTARIVALSEEDLSDKDLAEKLARTPADGLVTKAKNVALEIATADCLPLLLYEPNARIISAVHCGWRGIAKGIVGNALAEIELLGGKPKNLFAAAGPFICRDCYEVGDDVVKAFAPLKLSQAVFARRSGGKHLLDLGRAVFELLARGGVLPERIDISDDCTLHNIDRRFASYRREKSAAKRQLSLIWLR
ncbi:MAG: peptidoglycan editing factor PgeF [Myxococcota bacterium]